MECGVGADFKKSGAIPLGQVRRFNGAYEPTSSGTIEIRLGRAMVVIDGTVDTNVLRMILETLRV